MTNASGIQPLESFRQIVADRLGLQFREGSMEHLADVFRGRLQSRGLGSAAYLDLLAGSVAAREELRILASQLTVTETYFLRHGDNFRALVDVALPERIRARSAERRLRLLSAGCASGEEAYSLAILLYRHFPALTGWDVDITGVDINPVMIEKARAGRYSRWSLRETPADIRSECFSLQDQNYLLESSLRAKVRFEEGNLAADSDSVLSAGYDVVFCRNVLMYLTPHAARHVIERLTRAICPAGFLFLSYVETLRGLSVDFLLRHTHNTFYYQKKEGCEEPVAASSAAAVDLSLPPQLPAVNEIGSAWTEAIERSFHRIASLSRACSRADGAGAGDDRPRDGIGRAGALGLTLELLRQERFADALEVLGRLPRESALDPDFHLLRAVLLSNCGQPGQAEAACRELLARDDLNAGAHYLTALCRAQAGDSEAAREHARLASYLDPAFALPHLHLGLLARRSGDPATARAEFEQAATLLPAEDASRILLFGGGFSREALLEFSRAELCACGGAV